MIADLVLIGLAITLFPLALTAFILILSARGGVAKGGAFIIGWLLSLGIVMTVTILGTGNNPPKSSTAPSVGSLAAKILIGVGLLLFAERRRRTMGRPKPPKKQPKWQTKVDSMSPWYAIGLAPFLQPPYNGHRPHRALGQRPPEVLAPRPIPDLTTPVIRRHVLGGLIHEYDLAA